MSDTATIAVGDPLNHSFTNKASDELASAATCTEAAKYYVQCDRCDEVSDTVTVAVGEAKGHVEVTVPGFAPTCTSTGLTAGKRCAVCGEILVKQTGLPMTGHAYKAVHHRAHLHGGRLHEIHLRELRGRLYHE